MSHKREAQRSETYFREAIPNPRTLPQGTQLLCPFCIPTHPLMPSQPSACGTVLKVTAVQMVYTKRTVMSKKMLCVKCKQGGGEMIAYMNSYVHLPDCQPAVKLLPNLPDFNWWAERVYKLPERARDWIEKYTGKVQYVKEIDKQGEKTGKVLGYFFFPKNNSNVGFTLPKGDAKREVTS